jgi:hypothetical protein
MSVGLLSRQRDPTQLINLAMCNRTTKPEIKTNPYLPKINSTSEIATYTTISEGNGIPYRVYLSDINSIQKNSMSYAPMQTMIQIFIELRNALGFKSHPPHMFVMDELKNAINILQIEYARKYGIKYSYGYRIIIADPFFEEENIRDYTTLVKERKQELGDATLIINEDTIDLEDELLNEAENDAYEVTTLYDVRIYDNDYVKRRKKPPRRDVVLNEPKWS